MACPPGMRGCAVTCGHRKFVEGYREERQRLEIEAENVSLGYDTEYKEWVADHPLPTFKQWLRQSKRPDEMPKPTPQEFRVGDTVWHHERQQFYKVIQYDREALGLQGMNSREKMLLDPDEIERRTWQEVDRPVEVAKANATWADDRKAEAANEAAEMRRYLADDHELPTLQESRDYNETGLLGGAMVSDEAIPALRTVRDEFADVYHENVGRVILHQADAGMPHDAETVTAVLREADQLRFTDDPEYAMRTVDGSEYGLGAWAKGANPADANALAQAIRSDYRTRYLSNLGAELQQSALAHAEAGEDPGLVYQSRGQARTSLFADHASKLINLPPRLDLDLREIKNTATLESVDTRKPVRVAEVRSEATTAAQLGLPAKPVLTTVSKVAASA